MNPGDYKMGSFTIKRLTNTFKIRDSKGVIWHLNTTASRELVKASIDYLQSIGESEIVRLIKLLDWNGHKAEALSGYKDVDFVL